ncbi:hypothetical protein TIFTF001_020571 [Ficus carica]|uniref:DUF4216 domain-containing protein n=1 Tax=Ficus carica TaxID=3494 RepID=A0AA88DCR2_FICCA|nr:hypothetical protein TIFTF001_020571 [Ficus carica]
MHAESTVSDDLYALVNEPNLNIHSYPSCMVNGVRYHSRMRDEISTTQNYDVVLRQNYMMCSWFDNNEKKKRTKKEFNFTSIRTDLLWFEGEPYALADQVKQVLYVDDNKNGEAWKVVQKVNHRQILEITSKLQANDDSDEEDIDNDAYQEELSTDIDLDDEPVNEFDIADSNKEIDDRSEETDGDIDSDNSK